MKRVISRIRRGLRQFGTGQQDSALEQDLALPNGDLAQLTSARSHIREQMERMAIAHGVQPKEIDSERWRAVEIVQNCQNCDSVNGCQRFLDGKKSTFELTDCPNTKNYRELLQNR